jgi:ketosteroid isomerase-like protein
MKGILLILMAGLASIPAALLAQSKSEIAFTTSSPDAKKLLRNAWVAYGDAKIEEGDSLVHEALKKDPEFGMAHAFIYSEDERVREQNLKKASGFQLSADEKTFINGVVAAQRHESVASYFDPLVTKYPKDYYLHLWMMFYDQNLKRRTEIGEMIVKRSPKFAPAYNQLGYAYLAQHELKKAEANFNKYLSLSPDVANAYDSKADYLMRIGKIAEATALFEKAGGMGMEISGRRADVAKAMLKYPGPSEKDKQEMRNIISTISAAYVKGDVDAILSHYAGQAIEFPSDLVANAGIANIRTRLGGPFNYGSYTSHSRSVQSIEGRGPIAVAWGKTESKFKSGDNITERQSDDIFLFRKQRDGSWKILVHHWVPTGEGMTAPSPADSLAVREAINKWSFFIKPGEVLGQQHIENLSAVHSSQGIEIIPNQQSFIGMANMRMRWSGALGMTWAQFTALNWDVNTFATTPAGGFRTAVAWGIGDHSNYWKGSDKLSKYLFPWAMILTKEKDDQWRILVYHFFLE